MDLKIRLPSEDKRKSPAVRKKQILENLTCSLEKCNNPISEYTGLNSNTLCRKHMLEQREYGKWGRKDRPHTFHRKFECDDCGYKPLEDPRLESITNEYTKRQVARILMHGDHNTRQADGGDDSADNIRCLCYVCHAKKTILEEDYKKR